MPNLDPPTTTPKVTEALARDLGKALVRLDPDDIGRLGLKVGDIVELVGRRRTVGKLMPTYSAYRGRGRVQIDGITRENAGAEIDDALEVRPVESGAAEHVLLQPMSQPPTEAEVRALPRLLAGVPMLAGDRIRVNLLGQRTADFKVAKTTPGGPVVFGATTRLELDGRLGKPGPPEAGKSFRPFAYEDVGGLERELGRIREIVELPLRFPEVFEQLGIAPPKGVLLHGPPGCGKTLIARAVANETEASFFSINGPEIIHKYYGESEARLRDVFEQAERQAPSIVFLDEIDAIAPKRDRVVGDVEKRVVSQLLTLLDGLERRSQVVVIAATNMPNALDPALRRPGRFDREIAIPIPDREARWAILEVHRRGMPLAEDVDLAHVADVTHGFVGADLEALCREAAMTCLRRALPQLDFDGGAVPQDQLRRLEVTDEDFRLALREVEPSAIREVFIERPTTRWDDVGGLDDARRALIEAVSWPLSHAEVFTRAGVRLPRGVMLSGPPGCGKTLLAKAVANETRVNFLAVKGPELLSKYVGESERGVREVFHKARQAAPCLLFFDEIDALLPARGTDSTGDRAADRVIGQFLAEMDGVDALVGVLVLGATNRPDLLDPALLRPGRFDIHLAITPPDARAREAIARIALRDKPHADDVVPGLLVDATEGFSAEVRSVFDRAALAAVRDVIAEAFSGRPAQPLMTVLHLHQALHEVQASRQLSATRPPDHSSSNTLETGEPVRPICRSPNWPPLATA